MDKTSCAERSFAMSRFPQCKLDLWHLIKFAICCIIETFCKMRFLAVRKIAVNKRVKTRVFWRRLCFNFRS